VNTFTKKKGKKAHISDSFYEKQVVGKKVAQGTEKKTNGLEEKRV